MNYRSLLSASLLVCFTLLSGCGYELVREKGIYGGQIMSLNIPVFTNRSFEPQVPGFFTEAFSMELAGSGLFQINTAAADATLQGAITSVTSGPAALSAAGQTLQKTVTAIVGLTLTKEDKVVKTWTFGDSEVYDASSINLEDFNNRAALQRIASRMARRFHSQLLAIY
jgi:outer membrane lipopolysaccharide assembly protein LptE/RlpB